MMLILSLLLITITNAALGPDFEFTKVADYACCEGSCPAGTKYTKNPNAASDFDIDYLSCQKQCADRSRCLSFSHGAYNDVGYQCILLTNHGNVYTDENAKDVKNYQNYIDNNYKCYHKTAIAAPLAPVPVTATCEWVTPQNDMETDGETITLQNGDIYQSADTAQACQDLCAAAAGCNGYVWHSNLKRCWIKSAVTQLVSTTQNHRISSWCKPVSEAAVTLAPVTVAAVTLAPVTVAPVTAAPVTVAPVTVAPVTAAPVTVAPVTGNAPVKDDKIYTCGGTTYKEGEACSFPFHFNGVDNYACISDDHDQPWCDTEDGHWGNCNCDPVTPAPVMPVTPVTEASVSKWCAVIGRSPGSSLRKYNNVLDIVACEKLCEENDECLSIVYHDEGRPTPNQCWLLARTYHQNYEYVADGSYLANKGESDCRFTAPPTPAPTQMIRTKHIGCHMDKTADRAMAYKHYVKFLGIEECADVCRTKGAAYMGYQWQRECWCGAESEDVMKYGPGTGCVNGMGGPKWPLKTVFDLYEIQGAPAKAKETWCTQEGRSPGSSMARHTHVDTVLECQELCEGESRCLAFVKDPQGICYLLPRLYNGKYQAKAGYTAANKGQYENCGACSQFTSCGKCQEKSASCGWVPNARRVLATAAATTPATTSTYGGSCESRARRNLAPAVEHAADTSASESKGEMIAADGQCPK